MSGRPGFHLVERAVERMAELGTSPLAALARVANSAPVARSGPAAEDDARPADRRPAAPAPSVPSPAPTVAAPIIDVATLVAAGLAVAGARRSRVAEEWRVTSGQLLRALRTVPPRREGGIPAAANLLMVTSSKPLEGKSFAALNLAASLALGALAEVLLLDVDSKPGDLSALLGLGDRPGLFDLVADPALRPEDLVVATAIPGFAILPIGRAVGGLEAVERTVTRPVAAMIEQVAERFANRVVILDTAPCLATSDASTLAPTVDQIAMIVEAERTQRDDLEAALELLRPCPNITLVLNKVRVITGNAFGDPHYYDA
jgi:receptor protein-tyrosine kinase